MNWKELKEAMKEYLILCIISTVPQKQLKL